MGCGLMLPEKGTGLCRSNDFADLNSHSVVMLRVSFGKERRIIGNSAGKQV